MQEFDRQVINIFVLIGIFIFIIAIYKSDFFWNFSKGLPLHTNSGKCISINDRICLAEDSGLRVNYYQASSICSKRGMSLPSLEDAWDIWISSENCQNIFAINDIIPVNKHSFISNCKDETCRKPASKIDKYCANKSIIKFPMSSQYKNGSFWLKDSAEDDKHYAINYFSGKIGIYKSNINSFGVRCVKYY